MAEILLNYLRWGPTEAELPVWWLARADRHESSQDAKPLLGGRRIMGGGGSMNPGGYQLQLCHL